MGVLLGQRVRGVGVGGEMSFRRAFRRVVSSTLNPGHQDEDGLIHPCWEGDRDYHRTYVWRVLDKEKSLDMLETGPNRER